MAALTLVANNAQDVAPRPDIPPASMDAEAAVISAVILDATALSKVRDFLAPEHMFSQAHAWIYAACIALADEGKPLDALLVHEWLADRGRSQQVGGAQYINEVLDGSPHVANVREHAIVVYDKWRVRRVITACQKIAGVGYGDHGDAQAYCDQAAKVLVNVAQQTVLGRPESNLDALKRIARRLAEGANMTAAPGAQPRTRGIPTGIHSYDRLTFGLHSGQKTTICAHAGIGKTAFAMQIAWTVAESGVGVYVVSTEMSRDELLEREVCRRANIPFDRLQSGNLTPGDWSRFTAASSKLGELPLVIEDSGTVHIGQVCAATRAMAESMRTTHGAPLGLLVVDYIQNLEPAPEVMHRKEHEQVKHSTRELSALLKSLGIPGLELAQRKPADIDPKTKLRPKPAKGCVADSSWIEKSAHVVVCLQRQPLHNERGEVIGEDERNITAHVVKQRGGAERPIDLRFEGEYARFSDPNVPSPTPSRQYIDTDRDDENDLTEGL